MLQRLKTSPTHEELFADRYERLLSWSLQLSENDRELAEDLLHDAFVQFTFTQPDLKKIRDLNSYFYGMLRNLHLLQVRRETRNRLQQLPVVEYDSAADGLRTIDLRDRLQVQDELRRVCHYTCARKETSKSASVLILRFFHGYYPSEIAQVLRTSRSTVDVHLLTARNEARTIVDNPGAFTPMGGTAKVEVLPSALARTTDDFLGELRETIFRSRRNDCFSSEQVAAIYQSASPQIETWQLAHIVSCPPCLDEVNKMLKLPLLRDRLAIDSLSRDKRGKGCGDGPSGGAAGGAMNRLRRRARRVFEHKPQELSVSVNGYVQGSQRINAELSELSLNVNLPEDIGCVEVFSEQQVRLLLLSVEDLPPVGAAEQSSRIELSEGRTLDLTVKFRSPLPALEVVYQDPTFKEVETLLANPGERDVVVEPLENGAVFSRPSAESDAPGPFRQRCLNLISRLTGRPWAHWSFLMKPSVITALIALIAIAAILLTFRPTAPPPTISAGDVLHRSALAEEAIAARSDQVIHRIVNFEARKVAAGSSEGGELIANRRIEIWQSGEKGITARRLYDEKNALVAGDWRRKDGVQTLYQHGARPRIQLAPERRVVTSTLNADNVWQLSPSAADLLALIGSPDRTRVEQRGNLYVVTYENQGMATSGSGLIRASLTLSHDDLHAIELTLLVRQGDANPQSELRSPQFVEYRFTETAFQPQPLSAVAPSVFEPEPELLSSLELGTRNPKPETNALTPVPQPLVPVTASADLEVEVLRLLHQAGADLDDQTTVTRTPDGRLRIGGLVENLERKLEILRALAPVAGNPALKVEIRTVAEAVATQKQSPASSSSPTVSIQSVEANADTFPAYQELRNRFSDEEARAFATRMVGRSREAMRHAWALKRLINQFSAEELRTLAPEARAKWFSLIRDHARAFERETAGLRQELQPIFSPGAGGNGSGAEITIAGDADLDRAVERLFELGSANDQVVRSAFTISSTGSTTTAVRTAQFWRALGDAQKLAAKISRQ